MVCCPAVQNGESVVVSSWSAHKSRVITHLPRRHSLAFDSQRLWPPPLLCAGNAAVASLEDERELESHRSKQTPKSQNRQTSKSQQPVSTNRSKEIKRKTYNFARFQRWKVQRRTFATAGTTGTFTYEGVARNLSCGEWAKTRS